MKNSTHTNRAETAQGDSKMTIEEAIARLKEIQESHSGDLLLCDERGVSVMFDVEHHDMRDGNIVLVWT